MHFGCWFWCGDVDFVGELLTGRVGRLVSTGVVVGEKQRLTSQELELVFTYFPWRTRGSVWVEAWKCILELLVSGMWIVYDTLCWACINLTKASLFPNQFALS